MKGAEILKSDGVLFLSVKSSKGHGAMINLTHFANTLPPITGYSLIEWAQENVSNVELRNCRRCGLPIRLGPDDEYTCIQGDYHYHNSCHDLQQEDDLGAPE